MNAVVQHTETRPARQVVEDVVPILDTARFEHMQRIATIMANASLIPESLRTFKEGDKTIPLAFEHVMANCFLVVNQATKWNMDPFGVAQCVSVVKGKLCYEGKLVAAVLDAKLGIELSYAYNGKSGDALGVTVSGTINGVTKTVEGTVGGWKTTGNNSPWSSAANHQRQLAYRGAREWARLHKPALMLGAYTDDELADLQDASRANRARDISPPPPPPPALETHVEAAPISETAPAAPESQQEAQVTGASDNAPPAADAPATDTIAEEDAKSFAESVEAAVAAASTVETLEAGWAELDVEATLTGAPEWLAHVIAVKNKRLTDIEREATAASNAKPETAQDTAPPPPPALADDDEPEAPPPPPAADGDGLPGDANFNMDWSGITTKVAYEAFATGLAKHALALRNAQMLADFWDESQDVRAKCVPFAERKPIKQMLMDQMAFINAAIQQAQKKA